MEAFLRVAVLCGTAQSFREPGFEVSYARLAAAAIRTSRFLEEHPDWSPGTRVGLRLRSNAKYAAGFFGILMAGGVVVPVPPGTPEDHAARCLELTGCRLHFVEETGDEELALDGGPHGPLDAPSTHHAPDDLAAIFFTSGSTGRPKGVMLSRRCLQSNAFAIVQLLGLESRDRTLVTLPFHHAFGNSVLQSHLLVGASLVVDPRLSPLESIASVRKHGVTNLYSIPDGCVLLERQLRDRPTPETLRFVGVAGGRLQPGLALSLASAVAPAKLYVMYGQTEATARLSCLPPERLEEKPGSIGRAIPGVRLQVVDEEDRPVEPGRIGMIRARGSNVCLGYWKDPEGTSRILRERWLYTQDLGEVDEEGFLYHRGRVDQVLKIGGRRVDANWIAHETETATSASHCLAVPFETTAGSTRIALFYMGDEGVRGEILEWCRRTLAEEERPAYMERIDRFPRLASGKPNFEALSKRARTRWGRRRRTRKPEDETR